MKKAQTYERFRLMDSTPGGPVGEEGGREDIALSATDMAAR